MKTSESFQFLGGELKETQDETLFLELALRGYDLSRLRDLIQRYLLPKVTSKTYPLALQSLTPWSAGKTRSDASKVSRQASVLEYSEGLGHRADVSRGAIGHL
jgi:hypothetical protein